MSIRNSDFSFKEGFTVFLLIQATAFAVYGIALTFGFLSTWDDPSYILNNAAAHGFSVDNIRAAFTRFYVGNYAPLHIVSYMLDYTLWGLNPAGYTFHNIFLHATNGFLLFVLLRRFSLEPVAAVIAALFFVVHPVQVESVVWISQRKTVLAMFFFLLALIFYKQQRDSDKPGGRDYLLSLLFFVAALLAKSVTVVFPLIIVLHDICVSRRKWTAAVVAALPYAVFAGAIAVLAMMSQSAEYGGGGRTAFHGGGRLSTLFTMLPVFVSYVRMIVAPYGLSVVYAPVVRQTPDVVVLGSALLMAALAAAGVWLYRRNSVGFFWYAFIPVAILPVSQLVPLITMMNDRYLYFPLLGVAACLGMGAGQLRERWGSKGWRPVFVAALVILGGYGLISFNRTKNWQSPLTLWQDAVAKQPASAVAWLILGELYADRADTAAALKYLDKAKDLCVGAECYHAYKKLGSVYLKAENYGMAGKCYDELIARFPKNANGYLLKGYLDYRTNNIAQAEKMLLAGVSIDPYQPAALQALGNIYLASGQTKRAQEKLLAAYNLGNPSMELYYSLACVEALLQNPQASLNYLESALRLGYNNLNLIMTNRELSSIRTDAAFVRLMNRYFPGEKSIKPKGMYQ